MSESIIKASCIIRENKITLNGETIFESLPSKSFTEFAKEAYNYFDMSYPKFFKMDNLSKLGMLCSEGLRLSQGVKNLYESDQCALVFSNHSSSIESDRSHAQSISNPNDFFPSPSVFVYTLANIVLGEVAIKNKMQGENLFLLSEKFDSTQLHLAVKTLFETTSTKSALCGWVEFDGNKWESLLYIVVKIDDSSQKFGNFDAHSIEEINKLYNH